MTGSTTKVGAPSAAASAPPAASAPSPSAVYAPATFTPLPSTEQSGSHAFLSRFTRGARTPLPELVVAAAVVLATIVLVRRALETAGTGGSGGPGRTWWSAVVSLTIGNQYLGIEGATGSRVWLAFAALLVSLLAVVALARRIGLNSRHDLFGAGLGLAALPWWWLMPVILPAGRFPDRTELILRLVVALCLLLAQAALARWIFTARLWRASGLPGSLGSLVLWLPLTVANLWLIGPTLWSVIARGENGRGKSSWELTDSIVRAEALVTRGAAVLFALVLIVAAVAQHVTLGQARRAALASS